MPDDHAEPSHTTAFGTPQPRSIYRCGSVSAMRFPERPGPGRFRSLLQRPIAIHWRTGPPSGQSDRADLDCRNCLSKFPEPAGAARLPPSDWPDLRIAGGPREQFRPCGISTPVIAADRIPYNPYQPSGPPYKSVAAIGDQPAPGEPRIEYGAGSPQLQSRLQR